MLDGGAAGVRGRLAARGRLLDALQARLGDTLRVVSSTELLAAWVALPGEALEALLDPGRLQVDCEETVVVLLHQWVEKNSATQPRRLHSFTRPLALGPAYQLNVLPKLQWFRLSASGVADLLLQLCAWADWTARLVQRS